MVCFFSLNKNHENKDKTSAATLYFLDFFGTNYTGNKNPPDNFSCGTHQYFGATVIISKESTPAQPARTIYSSSIDKGSYYTFMTNLGYEYGVEFHFNLSYPIPDGFDFYDWYEGTYYDYDGGTWEWSRLHALPSGVLKRTYSTTSENPPRVCALFTCDISDYKINYNLKGGTSNNLNPSTAKWAQDITIYAPTRAGYTFTGWTISTGSICQHYYGASTSSYSTTAASSFTYSTTGTSYYKNLNDKGGTVSPTTKSVTFDSTYGTLPTPTRTGYSFTGWTLNGTKITSTTQVKTASNHTLVAQWTANSYTVTFNPTGGTVSETTKSVTYDSTYGDLPIPTRAGYVFIGWYTDPNGGSQVLSTTKVQTANNHTIYAHWQDTWYSYATQPTGNGTPTNPYIIDSAEDLTWIAKDIADNGTKSNYYKQTKPIDLAGHYWLPIGSDSNHSFNGLYDGQGFEIKNLKTYFPTNPDTPELQVNVGLFGYTAGSANIRGIVLRNATIKGAHNTGGIIGQATGKTIVKDIAVDNLNITTTMSYIGTIIGKSESTNVTIKNVVVYSATTSHNHRGLNSGEATIDSCLVSIQESKKYHDNTGEGFDFTQWVYISGLKMPVPKGLSWLANGGEPLTKEVLESLGFSAYQY